MNIFTQFLAFIAMSFVAIFLVGGAILLKYIPLAIVLASVLKLFGVIQATWVQVIVWPSLTWMALLLIFATAAAVVKK
jgi:MFS superfamily sulfate permease-like transporter